MRIADRAFAEGRSDFRVEWSSGREISSMHDAMLCRAVCVYVWGDEGRPWPSREPEAVARVLGEDALDLIPRVQEIFGRADEIATVDAQGPGASLSLRDLIAARIGDRYPGLDDVALKAIATEWAWVNK